MTDPDILKVRFTNGGAGYWEATFDLDHPDSTFESITKELSRLVSQYLEDR